eukprot:TRINITY_DN539_c0_g1_i1.p1 TRINITY_DN539_c0_g1~~TRINITY_DN539_c0_g1_i1.p1  ORF type:complete len:76 (+),score=4.18 TRINITY_DN539_c0_g1_i1:125-352(+)
MLSSSQTLQQVAHNPSVRPETRKAAADASQFEHYSEEANRLEQEDRAIHAHQPLNNIYHINAHTPQSKAHLSKRT